VDGERPSGPERQCPQRFCKRQGLRPQRASQRPMGAQRRPTVQGQGARQALLNLFSAELSVLDYMNFLFSVLYLFYFFPCNLKCYLLLIRNWIDMKRLILLSFNNSINACTVVHLTT
jgi:hypothetical protein